MRSECQVWPKSQGCSGPNLQLTGPPRPRLVPGAPSSGAKAWSKRCSAEPWGTAYRKSGATQKL